MAQRSPDRSGLHELPAAVLEEELRRRQTRLKSLLRRRERLIARLAELERQIEAAGGSLALPFEGARRRPRNQLTLTQALAKVLDGRAMSVAEAADAVQQLGYQTTSDNFRTQVNIALIKGKFRRVGRGRYTGI